MGRTQIYLGEDELELLDRESRTTGASRSELIRRAVRSAFGERTTAERLEALGGRALARQYHRAHNGIDDADYLIAATALVLEAELLTMNVQHFPTLAGLQPAY